jgi:hypothetical protein
MTQLGESVMVALVADTKANDKCPFCYKAKHAFASEKFAPDANVVSKPKDLHCAYLPVKGEWAHTTAAHHLISAKQCYAKVRRLVRMASMAGYDVNNPNNGISLPTVANNITYSLRGVGPQKYGRFSAPDKRAIAFAVMKQAGAQWHVGHHAVTVEIPEDWADEADDSYLGHTVSYDEAVIKELLDLMDAWVERGWCDEEDDQSEEIKKSLDDLSARIKARLDSFGTGTPRESTPFFVSDLAFEYANGYKKRKNQDLQQDDDGMEEDTSEDTADLRPRKKVKRRK